MSEDFQADQPDPSQLLDYSHQGPLQVPGFEQPAADIARSLVDGSTLTVTGEADFDPWRRHLLSLSETKDIEPGHPEMLPPGTALAGPEENIEKFGLGFAANLRGIVQLSPHEDGTAGEELYIFDRGEKPATGVFANLGGSASNIIMNPKHRYVIISGKGIAELREAIDNNYSMKIQRGWQGFSGEGRVRIGRNNENLKSNMSTEVSSGHADLWFGNDGSIIVGDVHSTNGTRLIIPTTKAETLPKYEPPEMIKPKFEFQLGEAKAELVGIARDHGTAYVFRTKDKAGKERTFAAYRSRSEGNWRVTQGKDFQERLAKGGENAKYPDHYTQETQLHPDLQKVINQLEEDAQNIYEKVEMPRLHTSDELNASNRDFSDQVNMYGLPDKKVYEAIRMIRPGYLDKNIGRILGLKPETPFVNVQETLMTRIDEINHRLQKSRLLPDFSRPTAINEDTHPILGKIQKETYQVAVDGHKYEWTFSSTPGYQKVWIDRIRLADSPPSTYGTDRDIIDSAILTSKPVEYSDQCEAVPDNLKTHTGTRDYVDITPFLGQLYPVRAYKQSKTGKR